MRAELIVLLILLSIYTGFSAVMSFFILDELRKIRAALKLLIDKGEQR